MNGNQGASWSNGAKGKACFKMMSSISGRGGGLWRVNVAPVAHANDGYGLIAIVDQIDDPVIANSDAPAFKGPFQLASSRRPGLVAEGEDMPVNALEQGTGQPA